MSERERIEVGKCLGCGCDLFFDNYVRCMTCAVALQLKPSVSPARDWKPGEKVLVPGMVFSDQAINGKIVVQVGKFSVWFPLFSIHPMTDAGRDGNS